MLHGNVVWLTGASSGIGHAFATRLIQEGYRVYGTTRKLLKDGKTAGKNGGFLQMLQMDVTNERQIAAAVNGIMQEAGRIDILINCAGMGLVGSVEDTSYEEMKLQMDINFAGVHNTCRAVLPIMRQQGQGLIINVSSLGSLFSIPFQGFYSVSKAAVDTLTEVLWMEARPFGIKCCSILPGDFKTRFTDSRIYAKKSLENPAYLTNMTKAVYTMEQNEFEGDELELIVDLLIDILAMEEPPVHIPVGTGCAERSQLVKTQPIEGTLRTLMQRYFDNGTEPPQNWIEEKRKQTIK